MQMQPPASVVGLERIGIAANALRTPQLTAPLPTSLSVLSAAPARTSTMPGHEGAGAGKARKMMPADFQPKLDQARLKAWMGASFHQSAMPSIPTWIGKDCHIWPAPEGAFQGRRMEVFWDIENCSLNNCYPYMKATDPNYLSPHRHYDLLINVFASSCGIKMPDFKLHAGVSQLHLKKLPPPLRTSVQKLHSPYVSMVTPLGNQKGLKAEQHGLDGHLLQRMEAYLSSAMPGDLLVLISGDGDYLPTLRRAYLEKGVRILLLYSKGRLAQDYIDKQGNVSDAISWFCEWGTFLSSHRHRENLMRTPVLKIQEHLLAGEAQNIKDSDNMGDLCICFLIDATDSMNDCIERVKDDLQRGLLTELFIRYRRLRGRVRFNFVAYRDIADAARERWQFKVYPDCERDPQGGSFTHDVELLKQRLAAVKASGGGDRAEDVAGALLKVASLQWDPFCTNVIFHIFDEPGHGKEFHDLGNGRNVDDYYEGPAPGRRDPAVEILEAVTRLKSEDCNVLKYYMMTLNRKGALPSPTAKTVAKIAAIGRAVPPCSFSVERCLGNTEAWAEEIQLGSDAVQLVRSMISASSRTLAASSSISRLLTRNKVKTFEKVLPELEEEGLVSADWLNDQDAASTVSLASLLTPGNTGTATAAATAVAGGNAGDAGSNAGSTSTAGSSSQPGSAGGAPAAQNAALKGTAQVAQARTGPGAAIAAASAANNPNRLCSDIYRQWAETHGSKSLQKIKSGFAHVPVQDVQLVGLNAPQAIEDLKDRVSANCALDSRAFSNPTLKFRIREKPFARGAERLCYMAMEDGAFWMEKDDLQVLKEFRYLGKGMNTIDRYKKLLSSHLVSQFLAEEYNRVLDASTAGAASSVGPERLEYLEASIVRNKTKDKVSMNRFKEVFMLGRFRKFTNNYGYTAPPADFISVCDAFGHWTYQATDGCVLVTDVQGWFNQDEKRVYLTDPCVHCSRPNLMDDQFKDGGLIGMENYFASHECGDTCKALQLDKACSVTSALQELRSRIAAVLKADSVDSDIAVFKADCSGPASEQEGDALNDILDAMLPDPSDEEQGSSGDESVADPAPEQDPGAAADAAAAAPAGTTGAGRGGQNGAGRGRGKGYKGRVRGRGRGKGRGRGRGPPAPASESGGRGGDGGKGGRGGKGGKGRGG